MPCTNTCMLTTRLGRGKMTGNMDKAESNPEGPGGRSMGTWLQKGGQRAVVLLEWITVEPNTLLTYLKDVEERIPTGGHRREEIHMLKIHSIFRKGPRTALMYRCSQQQQPVDLRQVLLKVQKPSGEDRRALSRIIATQVRSLHVHFQLSPRFTNREFRLLR